jgi:lysyl-tRNA synthetase class 1
VYWADKIAKQIIDSGKYKPYWVDDMKTPSGFSHVGSLRGPLIHSVVFRALSSAGVSTKFTYVFNDFDPADELPSEFKEKLAQYMGYPLKKIPSPQEEFENLADLLADDLRASMVSLGVEADFLSSWDMYHQGKFDEVIKVALDNSEKIQDIYQKVSGSRKKEQGWLPFQVICENCGKLGTTRVFAWDGKEVSFKCEPNLVVWAKGCGHEGSISPFGGNGKLPWKVDWAAHWKVVGVTIEGAGKDHASKGGSYDIAMALCDKVFDYPPPFKLPIEFFLIGGRKMSSSKGLGLKAHDLVKILPPEVGRFLFTRTDYREQINFDPVGTMAIPDLFDEYDRAWQAYVDGSDETLGRAFELSQIKDVPKKDRVFLPRFRDVANYMQLPNIDLKKKFEEEKGSTLNSEESRHLEERKKYAQIWIENYAPGEFKIEMAKSISPEVKKLSAEQKKFLEGVIRLLEKQSDPEKLQVELYELTKTQKIDTKKAFSAIYLALIGRDHGPKAAWFLLQYPKGKVIQRLEEVSK